MNASDDRLERLRREIGIESDRLAARSSAAGVVPLRLHCANTDCANGRHFFNHITGRQARRNEWQAPAGTCCSCGAHAFEPEELLVDADEPNASLVPMFRLQQLELMRAHYWTAPIDLRAYNQALRMGRTRLHAKANRKIRHDLQTIDDFATRRAKLDGCIVSYAQHATATCCYQCAAIWHGFPMPEAGTPSEAQLQRAVEAAILYLDLRLPDLADEGLGIPGVPRSADMVDDDIVEEMDRALVHDIEQQRDAAGLVYAKNSAIKVRPFRYTGTSQVQFLYSPSLKTGTGST